MIGVIAVFNFQPLRSMLMTRMGILLAVTILSVTMLSLSVPGAVSVGMLVLTTILPLQLHIVRAS